MNQEIKYFLFIFITFGIGSVLIQGLVVPYIAIGSVWKPDLVVIIVLLIGKRFGSVARFLNHHADWDYSPAKSNGRLLRRENVCS